MKPKVLIIAFLIISLLGAFTLNSNAQDSTLIADETWVTLVKTGARITTYSEQVFKDISLKWGEKFKAIHIYYKTDRHGKYKQWQITISKETGINIQKWAENNL